MQGAAAGTGQGRVTIRQVAERAGVSVATVSRVLNKSRPVAPEIETRVWEVVRQLDYRPSSAARYMKGQKTGSIGMLVPDLSHPFFATIAAGAVAEATRRDQVLVISSSEGRREQEVTAIDQLSRSLIDGLIYIPVATGDPLPEVQRFRHLPVVVVGRRGVFRDRPHVYTDNVKGGYVATKYLLALGRRRIAFLAGFWVPPCSADTIKEASEREDAGAFTTLDRFRGYLRALEEEGVPFDRDLVVISGYDFAAGYKAAAELIGRVTPVDGILAANDLVAAGVLALLREQGIAVPSEISVIGYDDGPGASLTYPGLTSVRQDARRLGAAAVEVMSRLLMGEKVGDTVVDVSLTIRGSTTARVGGDERLGVRMGPGVAPAGSAGQGRAGGDGGVPSR